MRLNAAEQAMVDRDNAAARAEADAAKAAIEAAKVAFEAAKIDQTTPTPTTNAAQPAATPATEDDDTEPDPPTPTTPADDTPADDQDEPTTWSTLRALWAAPGEGAPSSLIDHTNDDRGNGERFVHYWGNRVAWVLEIKATRLWNGAIWQTDTSGSGMRHLAERMTDFMLVDARLLIQKYGQLLAHLADEEGSAVSARPRAEPVGPAEQHRLRGSFGWEVVSRRLASRLSQRALSAASGVSLRWLVTLEQGQGRPSDDVCRKLAAGFLPDGSELARAVLDLRLRRSAGESLVMWHRRRPPRVATRQLYARAAAVLDSEDAKREAEQQVTAAAFLEEFRAQWRADAVASTRPPSNPAQAWPGRWPRVRG